MIYIHLELLDYPEICLYLGYLWCQDAYHYCITVQDIQGSLRLLPLTLRMYIL
jgi:hypothetical protein